MNDQINSASTKSKLVFAPQFAAAAIALCTATGGTAAMTVSPTFAGAGTGNMSAARQLLEDRGPKPLRKRLTSSSSTTLSYSEQTIAYDFASQWSNSIDSKISEIANLEANWDGEGALSIPGKVVERLRALCWQFPAYLPAPTMKVGAEGNAGMYWDTQSGYVEIDVMPAGEFCIYHAGADYEPIAYHEVRTIDDAMGCFLHEWNRVVAIEAMALSA